MSKQIIMMTRRRSLSFLGAAGIAAILGRGRQNTLKAADATICVSTPTGEEGPFWVDEQLNRSDVRTDPTTGVAQAGLPLVLNITVHDISDSTCSILSGARVDIWSCNAEGVYSDESQENTVGVKWLRGYQVTDDNGAVTFTTNYPGWYSGRAVHVHARVRAYSGSTVYDEFTTQLFFDDTITTEVQSQAPYSTHGTRDTLNATDRVYNAAGNGSLLLLALTKTDTGYTGAIDLGVALKTAAVTTPTVTAVVNAASYAAGVAPGAWISIFGQNLAATTASLSASDIVNNLLPTTLGGVSVQIDGQAAFVDYVSPTQINVQAPADANTGAVQVTVTNSSGTSQAVSATLQSILPGFFASNNYVAAVTSDGVMITGSTSTTSGTTASAKPGQVIELYGTGFGATEPIVAPGAVAQTVAAVTNTVTITIGGVAANVLWAGLSAAGLYQFNIMVPTVADGDQAVIAQIAGVQTQSGVLLKVQS